LALFACPELVEGHVLSPADGGIEGREGKKEFFSRQERRVSQRKEREERFSYSKKFD